ncbi:reverse transcriptase domain-containing protein [Tanacetum coccineum]
MREISSVIKGMKPAEKRNFQRREALFLKDPFLFNILYADQVIRRCVFGKESHDILMVATMVTSGHHRVKEKFRNGMRCHYKFHPKFVKSLSSGALTYGAIPIFKIKKIRLPLSAKSLILSDRGTIFAMTICKGTLGRKTRTFWSDKLDDALWAFRTAYKTPIGCTPYKLVYGKACHLPIELEHKAIEPFKHTNLIGKKVGDHREVQLNELN